MQIKNKEWVLEEVKMRKVEFIRLWFTDILGSLKSFAITVEGLEAALEEGVGFDGSSIEGFARIEESDMIAMPDPSTFSLMPSSSNQLGVMAKIFCDILKPDGNPYAEDPRYVLKRNLKRASDIGYTFYVGPELEYFYFQSCQVPPQGLDKGGYFDFMATKLETVPGDLLPEQYTAGKTVEELMPGWRMTNDERARYLGFAFFML